MIMGMNIVDFLIIFLLVLSIIKGYKKGFFGSLVGVFSSLCGLLAAYHFHSSLTQWAERQFGVIGILGEYFNERLVLPEIISEFRLDSISLPELGPLLDNLALPGMLHTEIMLFYEKIQATLMQPLSMSLGEIIQQLLATLVVNVAAFLLLWFIVNQLIKVLVLMVTRILSGTLLGGLNRLGGVALMLLLRVFTLTILTGIIAPLLQLTQLTEPSLFSTALNTISEAKSIPYFLDLFVFLSEKTVNLLLF